MRRPENHSHEIWQPIDCSDRIKYINFTVLVSRAPKPYEALFAISGTNPERRIRKKTIRTNEANRPKLLGSG